MRNSHCIPRSLSIYRIKKGIGDGAINQQMHLWEIILRYALASPSLASLMGNCYCSAVCSAASGGVPDLVK